LGPSRQRGPTRVHVGGRRVGDRDPAQHQALQQPPAQQRLGRGQLDPVVDPPGLLLGRLGGGDPAALRQHLGHQVGQVVLALVVVGAQLGQAVEDRSAEHVHAGAHLTQLALGGAGVALLDDPGDGPAPVAQHPAVAGRVTEGAGGEGGGGPGRAVGVKQPLQQRRGDQRGVAGQDQDVAAALQQRQGGGQGVAGAPLAGLDGEGDRPKVEVLDGGGDLAGAAADDHDGLVRLEGAGGGQHMPEQRAAGDRVQRLGHGRTEPLAFSGGEHDDAQALAHRSPVPRSGAGGQGFEP
jgi:hypothetical protein